MNKNHFYGVNSAVGNYGIRVHRTNETRDDGFPVHPDDYSNSNRWIRKCYREKDVIRTREANINKVIHIGDLGDNPINNNTTGVPVFANQIRRKGMTATIPAPNNFQGRDQYGIYVEQYMHGALTNPALVGNQKPYAVTAANLHPNANHRDLFSVTISNGSLTSPGNYVTSNVSVNTYGAKMAHANLNMVDLTPIKADMHVSINELRAYVTHGARLRYYTFQLHTFLPASTHHVIPIMPLTGGYYMMDHSIVPVNDGILKRNPFGKWYQFDGNVGKTYMFDDNTRWGNIDTSNAKYPGTSFVHVFNFGRFDRIGTTLDRNNAFTTYGYDGTNGSGVYLRIHDYRYEDVLSNGSPNMSNKFIAHMSVVSPRTRSPNFGSGNTQSGLPNLVLLSSRARIGASTLMSSSDRHGLKFFNKTGQVNLDTRRANAPIKYVGLLDKRLTLPKDRKYWISQPSIEFAYASPKKITGRRISWKWYEEGNNLIVEPTFPTALMTQYDPYAINDHRTPLTGPSQDNDLDLAKKFSRFMPMIFEVADDLDIQSNYVRTATAVLNVTNEGLEDMYLPLNVQNWNTHTLGIQGYHVTQPGEDPIEAAYWKGDNILTKTGSTYVQPLPSASQLYVTLSKTGAANENGRVSAVFRITGNNTNGLSIHDVVWEQSDSSIANAITGSTDLPPNTNITIQGPNITLPQGSSKTVTIRYKIKRGNEVAFSRNNAMTFSGPVPNALPNRNQFHVTMTGSKGYPVQVEYSLSGANSDNCTISYTFKENRNYQFDIVDPTHFAVDKAIIPNQTVHVTGGIIDPPDSDNRQTIQEHHRFEFVVKRNGIVAFRDHVTGTWSGNSAGNHIGD